MAANESATDRWAEWLFKRRFGGDQAVYEGTMAHLRPIRDQILTLADIHAGDTVLDVGTGDGLLGFKALELTGNEGAVVFSDISQRAIDFCSEICQGEGLDNTRFVVASADQLDEIENESVDVVVCRAVLIYVQDKQSAFREFYRVLKMGGRISISEPVASFKRTFPVFRNEALSIGGFDLTPLGDIARRVLDEFRGKGAAMRNSASDPMLDFTERDLMLMARDAGFAEMDLQLFARYSNRNQYLHWSAFYETAPNPNSPTLREAAEAVLDEQELATFIEHLRPLVERAEGEFCQARIHLVAHKR